MLATASAGPNSVIGDMVYPENRAVAVIGAGPYGLSIAARLRSQGVNRKEAVKDRETT